MRRYEYEGLVKEYGENIKVLAEYNDSQNLFDFALIEFEGEQILFDLSSWEECDIEETIFEKLIER